MLSHIIPSFELPSWSDRQGLYTKGLSACPGQSNLAVRQAEFHANLPDRQPNISLFVDVLHIGQVKISFGQLIFKTSKYLFGQPVSGVEIRGRPIVRDHHFLGKDDHVLTDDSLSDDLIFSLN
jgi:hypothetical protein